MGETTLTEKGNEMNSRNEAEFQFNKTEDETKLMAVFVSTLFLSGICFDVENHSLYWIITLTGF